MIFPSNCAGGPVTVCGAIMFPNTSTENPVVFPSNSAEDMVNADGHVPLTFGKTEESNLSVPALVFGPQEDVSDCWIPILREIQHHVPSPFFLQNIYNNRQPTTGKVLALLKAALSSPLERYIQSWQLFCHLQLLPIRLWLMKLSHLMASLICNVWLPCT